VLSGELSSITMTSKSKELSKTITDMSIMQEVIFKTFLNFINLDHIQITTWFFIVENPNTNFIFKSTTLYK